MTRTDQQSHTAYDCFKSVRVIRAIRGQTEEVRCDYGSVGVTIGNVTFEARPGAR